MTGERCIRRSGESMMTWIRVQDPHVEIRLQQRSADAHVAETAVPHREPVGRYSHRKINLYALAPTMFHEAMIS